MLVIRLFRIGKINQPSFKIVVTDKRNSSKGGRFVEEVGFYNPVTKEKNLNKERAKYWVSQGAQPSPTVFNMLVKDGILQGKKIPVQKKSKKPIAAAPGKPAEAAAPVTPAAAPVAPAVEAAAPKVEEIKKEEPIKTEDKMKEAEPLSSEVPKTE